MKKIKEDVRSRIARAYIIDLVKNATDLEPEEEQLLLDAYNILLTANIPPLDD